MADEPVIEAVVKPAVVVEPAAVEPAVVEPAVVEPHPLAEGGARFNEVYARMKQAEERATRLEGERNAFQQQVQRPQQPQPVQYTPEQVADWLQAQVDRGQMTPMQAANQMSQFNAQRAATYTAVQTEQARAIGTKLQQASVEVNQYIDKVPSLRDTSSAEFRRVSESAYRLSDEMNIPVTDFRVQRAALREVYGTLDRLAAAGAAREGSRAASVPHVESSVRGQQAPAVKSTDALKDVPKEYLDHWKRRGYTEKQMIEEAKFVTKTPRKVPAR